MAKSLTRQTFGVPSQGVLELIETSDKVARLSEAGYAYETKLRALEHQFEVQFDGYTAHASPHAIERRTRISRPDDESASSYIGKNAPSLQDIGFHNEENGFAVLKVKGAGSAIRRGRRQDARFQERRVSSKISLSACSIVGVWFTAHAWPSIQG